MEDLLVAGVLDPAKVTRSGLTNACGIAGIMLTTQVDPALAATSRGTVLIDVYATSTQTCTLAAVQSGVGTRCRESHAGMACRPAACCKADMSNQSLLESCWDAWQAQRSRPG